MLFTPRINNAVALASHLHRNQFRNDARKTPYISHLVSVAMIVGEVTDDEDIVIAALMHDSLEDVPGYTYEKLVEDFGKRVADIVLSVTEPLDANKSHEEQLPWLARKEAYLERLVTGSQESIMVACADKIHNIESFIADYEREGASFSLRFGSSIRNRAWFHEQVLVVAKNKLKEGDPLLQRLEISVTTFSNLI